jgi:hypothetical protein
VASCRSCASKMLCSENASGFEWFREHFCQGTVFINTFSEQDITGLTQNAHDLSLDSSEGGASRQHHISSVLIG